MLDKELEQLQEDLWFKVRPQKDYYKFNLRIEKIRGHLQALSLD